MLHRLAVVELGAGQPAAAETWLERARVLLDSSAEKGANSSGADKDAVGRWRARQDELAARVRRAREGAPDERNAASEARAVAPGGLQLDPSVKEDAQASRRAAQAKLVVGRPISEIPERYAYLRDDGPNCPVRVQRVMFVEHERSAGMGSLVALALYVALVALFGVMALVNLLSGQALFGTISALLAIGFAGAALVTGQRIRAAAADARARRTGAYRLGWYFDGDALLLRMSGGFSAFPRERVTGVRIDSRYDSESNHTRRWLVLVYRDAAGESAELALDVDLDRPRTDMVALIDTWRLHGRQ